MRLLALLALLLAIAAAPAAWAQRQADTLRIASAFDPQTMDPHAVALLHHSRVMTQVYDGLVGRDERFRLEPALALAWRMTSPTTWVFKLRPGVVFHDGTPFSAEDAAFSLQRAAAAPSQRAFQLRGIAAARALDPLHLEVQLEAPDAVLPEKLSFVAMMSKAWCEKHGVQRAHGRDGQGSFNAGRYSNPQLDTLVNQLRVEPDLTRRRALVTTALRLAADDLPMIPLYRRTLNWAMARQVSVVQWPNDILELRWVHATPPK